MAVLFQMKSGQIELFASRNLGRLQSGLRRRRDRTATRRFGMPAKPVYLQRELVEGDIPHGNLLIKHSLRGQLKISMIELFPVIASQVHMGRLPGRRKQTQTDLALPGRVDVENHILICILDDSQFAVREEILDERLFLVRHDPAEIGLVLRVHARHQLDVRAVLVRQVPVPGAAEIAVPPSPLLLARGEAMVRHMQHTALRVVLVTALEIIVRGGDHIGGRDLDILVVGNVDTGRVIHLVIHTRRDREGADRPFSVVEDRIHVRREHALVSVVHLDGRIGPPQESLGNLGPVVQHSFYLKISTAGTKRESGHPLLVEHPLHLAAPDSHALIGILLDGAVHRHKGAGAVVLGPVELDAAANPRPCQADERRLDYLVIVNEMPIGNFVKGHLYPSAQFGENHDLDILVLQKDSVVFLVHLLVRDGLDDGIGINDAAASLIDTFLQEYGILFGLSCLIGRNRDLFFPSFNHGYLINSVSSCSRVFPFVSGSFFTKYARVTKQMAE